MVKHYNSGTASKYSWFDIPVATVTTIKGLEEPSEITGPSLENNERRFAQLVYVVNDATSSIAQINQQLLENENLKQYIEEDTANNITWVAEAAPGTLFTDTVWRVKKIETVNGSPLSITNVTWSGGTSNFVHSIDIGGAITSLEDLF